MKLFQKCVILMTISLMIIVKGDGELCLFLNEIDDNDIKRDENHSDCGIMIKIMIMSHSVSL